MPNLILPKLLASHHKRGVHFVLCRSKDEGGKKAKSALASGWQKRAAPLATVRKHDGLLGFIPGRSGLLVIDIDTFPGEDKDASGLVARLGDTPLAVISTPRGIHLYLKKASDDGEVGNRARTPLSLDLCRSAAGSLTPRTRC